ncbi:leucine-rich repeat-containing protein 43-like, partial [Watersipora subatra]|uniref:leucine-rich repeat-containing protein 43-like n=1 Tax=Watersipora subatra TaxID=2589382 RepID=UPI00355C1904
MTTSSSTTVTDAFQVLLKTLCVHEFPCGNGSWRKQVTVRTIPLNYGKKVMKIADKTEPQFSVTLKDYDATKSHIETLQEFCTYLTVSTKHSPWTFDYSWSDEARSLREIAVKDPEIIDDDFIHRHFVTLRLTDKGISDVDEQMLKFSNLEYLTLSANYIKNVNSKNLPRKLVSLELNSNLVSELFSLCVDPPALVHLGLGNNSLTYVDDYLSGDHWPALLSLDLSYNNLTDLPETLRKLKTLPNLRNIILMGNPLMLTPGYRGFVVDNLKTIDLLDDIRIEADERHRCIHMSKLTEQELCQCSITFELGHIKNVPKPLELEHPEEQSEYPTITRNYYVEFHYISKGRSGGEMFALDRANGFDFNPFADVDHEKDRGGRSSA